MMGTICQAKRLFDPQTESLQCPLADVGSTDILLTASKSHPHSTAQISMAIGELFGAII